MIQAKVKYAVILLLILFGWGGADAQVSFRILNINTRLSGEKVGYSAKPFADYIKQYDPDFVMLQEVDFMTVRNGGRDFTTELASELGMFPAFGCALQYVQGQYGVAILSKYPLETISNTNLTGNASEMKEIRTVLYVDVLLPNAGTNTKVRIACTHLDHSTDGVRQSMVQQLNTAVGNSFPAILTGDFNAKPNEDAINVGMASWQRLCNNFATYPNTVPASKIDYIFGKPSGRWTVKSYQVLQNTTGITDHCALLAEVEYK